MTTIYVDSDACPVKPEIVRVAKRYGLAVIFVSNSWMRLPEEWGAKLVVVEGQFDAADDWIVEHVVKNDVVVTGDIPLAHRSLKAGARVIGSQGRPFTEENIGNLLATRDLLHVLRGAEKCQAARRRLRKKTARGSSRGLIRSSRILKIADLTDPNNFTGWKYQFVPRVHR